MKTTKTHLKICGMNKVVFDFYDFRITWREIAVSIAILFLILSLGMTISNKIKDGFDNKEARQVVALRIDNNADMFNHALDTRIGDIVAYGQLSTKDPVSLAEIDGQFLYLEKVEEHYVQKTKVVTYSCNCNDNGCSTCTRVETYWEWDKVDSWKYRATTVSFLNREFSINKFNGYYDSHFTTIKKSSRVRFKYYTTPKEFFMTIKANTADGYLRSWDGRDTITIKQNQTIDEALAVSSFWRGFTLFMFWLLWITIMGFTIYGYVYLENGYLY